MAAGDPTLEAAYQTIEDLEADRAALRARIATLEATLAGRTQQDSDSSEMITNRIGMIQDDFRSVIHRATLGLRVLDAMYRDHKSLMNSKQISAAPAQDSASGTKSDNALDKRNCI